MQLSLDFERLINETHPQLVLPFGEEYKQFNEDIVKILTEIHSEEVTSQQ